MRFGGGSQERVFLLDRLRYLPPSDRGQGVGVHDGRHAPAGGACSGHRDIGGSPSRGHATGHYRAGGGRQRTRERPGMMTDHRHPPYPDRTAEQPAPGGLAGRASRRSLLPPALAIPLPYPLPCPARVLTAFPQHTMAFRCGDASSQPSSLLLSLTKPWEIGGGGVSVVETIIGFRARMVPSAAGRGRRPAGGRSRRMGGRG